MNSVLSHSLIMAIFFLCSLMLCVAFWPSSSSLPLIRLEVDEVRLSLRMASMILVMAARPPSSSTKGQYLFSSNRVRLATAQAAHSWHSGVCSTPSREIIGARLR